MQGSACINLSAYKSVCWKRTALVLCMVLRVLLRVHSEARTRQTQQPAASRRVRRLNIAARSLGSFQIRGHNGVVSPIYPKGAILPQIRHNPVASTLPPIGGCGLVRVSMHETKVTLS